MAAEFMKGRKTLLLLSGILYVIFGILAFFNIPGGHENEHHTYAHNLTHIILGVTLLVVTLRVRAAARRVLCFVFAMLYCVIGVYGMLRGESAMFKVVPGLVEFHAGDYMVHLTTAFFFFALALLRRSDQRGETQQTGN